ncbi:MAG: hypothetical protein ACXWV5_07550, partial [Flavitalea sp.]
MSYLHTHINTAEKILTTYKGIEPFHHHLRNFFKEYKKAGSKDRKNISHICYTYFRIGRALVDRTFQERLIAALLVCEPGSVYLKELQGELPKGVGEDLQAVVSKENLSDEQMGQEVVSKETLSDLQIDAVKKLFPDFNMDQIFPFNEELSEGLDKNDYAKSFFNQPDLHVRVRPGKQTVADKLSSLSGYLRHSGNSFAFKNGTNLEAAVKTDRDVIIQDWSSQQVESFFPELPNKATIWDACAASGGKSLLAID